MKTLLFFIILLSINLINAAYSGGGCYPPLSFAKEHNCTLMHTSGREVEGYTCNEWKIHGDCEGGVIDAKKMFVFSAKANLILTIILAVIFTILLVTLIRMITKKPEDNERYFD